MRASPLVVFSVASALGCTDAHGPGCEGGCLTLAPTHRAAVHGHVFNSQAAPVAGATVRFVEAGSNRFWRADAPTTESGAYRVVVEVYLATSGLPDPDTLRGSVRAATATAQGSATAALPLRPLGETTALVIRDIVLSP